MPRPRTISPVGVGLGTAIGALLTGGWGGFLGGAAAGALLGQEPLPLEEALKQFLAGRDLTFVSLRSLSRSSISVVFRSSSGQFGSIHAVAPPGAPDVDDELYDEAVKEIEQWVGRYVHHAEPV